MASRAPSYGQVVVGPPGSGKTTYCDGMQQYLRLLGRDAWVINFDPANELVKMRTPGHAESKDNATALPYETLFDVCKEVVNLSSVMEKTELGPNGGLIYCMEYLEEHVDEIVKTIMDRMGERTYLIIDLPGQIELYTHNECVQKLLKRMMQLMDLRLTNVQLIDAFYCTDASKFLSAALLGTTTMLRLELPTVTVLSKVDLLAGYGELPLGLEFFTECHDLDRLVQFLNEPQDDDDIDIADDAEFRKARKKRLSSPFSRKFSRLHESLAEVVEDFGLIRFTPLNISDAESVGRVVAQVDKANGYVFVDTGDPANMFQCAVKTDNEYESLAAVKEHIEATDTEK